jgi:hypothetical protein
VLLAGGCVVNARLTAGAAVIANAELTPPARPLDEAVSV